MDIAVLDNGAVGTNKDVCERLLCNEGGWNLLQMCFFPLSITSFFHLLAIKFYALSFHQIIRLFFTQPRFSLSIFFSLSLMMLTIPKLAIFFCSESFRQNEKGQVEIGRCRTINSERKNLFFLLVFVYSVCQQDSKAEHGEKDAVNVMAKKKVCLLQKYFSSRLPAKNGSLNFHSLPCEMLWRHCSFRSLHISVKFMHN